MLDGDIGNWKPWPVGSSLHYAAISPVTFMILLLKHTKKLDIPNNDGATPLHMAISYNNEHTTALLLKSGANVGAVTHKGNTPLHLAIGLRHAKCAVLLMQYNPDILAVNNEDVKETPMSLAKKNKKTNAYVKILLKEIGYKDLQYYNI